MLRSFIFATAFLASSSVAPREEVVFAPFPGTHVEKHFVATSHLALDGASLVMDGEHSDVPLHLDTRSTTTLTVRDEYAEVGSGRPLRLERQYDEIGARAVTSSRADMTGGGKVEVTSASALQGRAVRFEWDATAEHHTRRFSDEESAPDEAEAALLAGVEEDLDLRVWLPPRALATGDRWQVEPAILASVLTPGGGLGLAPTDPDQAALLRRMGGASGLAGLLGRPTGTVEGRLVSIDGAPGDRRAHIAFDIDVRFLQELASEAWPAFTDPAPPGDDPVEARLVSTRVDALLESGRADLVWCIDAGRFESFTFEGAIDLALDQTLTLSLGDQDMEVRMALEFTLEQRLDATCRAR